MSGFLAGIKNAFDSVEFMTKLWVSYQRKYSQELKMFNANDLVRRWRDFKWHTAQDFKIRGGCFMTETMSVQCSLISVYTWCSLETQKPKAEW